MTSPHTFSIRRSWFGILQRYIPLKHVVYQGIWFSKHKLSFPYKQLILQELENQHFRIILILYYQPFVHFLQKIVIRCFWNRRSYGSDSYWVTWHFCIVWRKADAEAWKVAGIELLASSKNVSFQAKIQFHSVRNEHFLCKDVCPALSYVSPENCIRWFWNQHSYDRDLYWVTRHSCIV